MDNTTSAVKELLEALGEEVADPEEEAFLVFSQSIPSQNLGFVDSKASVLDITVAGRDLTIHQSPTILSSNRKEGTTGAVVWKVTPLFAEWIASPQNIFFQTGILSSAATALELGCGVSGIVSLALAPRIGRYIATDQDYALKLLRQNIVENAQQTASNQSKSRRGNQAKGKAVKSSPSSPVSIETMALDWETDSVSSLTALLEQMQANSDDKSSVDINVLIACDCIYNDVLIEPLVSTCAGICGLSSTSNPTFCIVAQQLRAAEVFESWLKAFHQSFRVWRVPDDLLIEGLRGNSGFVVHVGLLRQSVAD